MFKILLIIFKLLSIYGEIYQDSYIEPQRGDITTATMEINSFEEIYIFAGGIDPASIGFYNTVNIVQCNVLQYYIRKSCTNSSFNLPVTRFDFAITTLAKQRKIFFAGGASQQYSLDIVTINSLNNFSFSKGNLTQNRDSLSAISIEKFGILLFAGGFFLSNPSDLVDIYNSTINGWTTAKLSIPRGWMSSTSLSEYGLAFFAGGQDNNFNTFNIVDIYDAKYNIWTTAFLSSSGYRISSASLEKKSIVLFTGYSTQNSYSNIVDIYDVNEKKWRIANLSQNRTGIKIISFQPSNIILFLGGTNSQGELPIFDRYDADLNVWTNGNINYQLPFFTNTVVSYIDLAVFLKYDITKNYLLYNFIYACEKGYFPFIIFNKCIICPPGNYCPDGYFIYNCPLGYLCPEGSIEPIPCPAGTYADKINSCTPCPAGTFNIIFAQTSINNCLKCSLGFYCPIGSPIPTPCPNNFYCPDTTQQIACPSGKYFNGNLATNLSQCVLCTEGSYCSGNGQNAMPCAAGTYSSQPGNKECVICPEGNYCAYGSLFPILCPRNSYAGKGSSGCTPCDNEQFTEGAGKSTCISCPSSRFNLDGWWCMTVYERIIFVVIWLTTIISSVLTIWKIYSFIKNRLKQLNKNGTPLSIKNFVFMKKIEDEIKLTNIIENDMSSILTEYRQEINHMNNIILELSSQIKSIQNNK